LVRGILIFLLLLFLVVILVGVVLLGGLVLALPRLEELEPKTSALTSMVYDINGQLITTFHKRLIRAFVGGGSIRPQQHECQPVVYEEQVL